MTRLIIWRHGRTEWNATDRVQGHSDVDLDVVGVAQAAESAARIAAHGPDLIVSSDLRRAARTAAVLASITGRTVDYDNRLRERHYGPWQGLRLVEIDANRRPPIEMDGGRSLPASDAGDEPERAADDLRAGKL